MSSSAKTREAAAKRAAQGLAKVNANVLGLAVNRISYRMAGSHYYYYDYYEDRSGDDLGDGGRSRRSRRRVKEQLAEPVQPAATASFAGSKLGEF